MKVKKNKKQGKAHSYIFKWYLCGYIAIAIIVLHMNYEVWF